MELRARVAARASRLASSVIATNAASITRIVSEGIQVSKENVAHPEERATLSVWDVSNPGGAASSS